jgi:hypothetical protein
MRGPVPQRQHLHHGPDGNQTDQYRTSTTGQPSVTRFVTTDVAAPQTTLAPASAACRR